MSERRAAVVGVDNSRDSYFARPLAPAPVPAVAGVVACALVLLAAASRISDDWLAVFAGVGVLTLAWAVLDYTGRASAAAHPHPLYKPERLPSERTRLKTLLVIATLVAVVAFVAVTASPDRRASALPYFVGVLFLIIVMPQMLARRMVREYDRRRGLARK